MLAETVNYLQPVYLVSWGAIGFVLGLIACIVLAIKGHGGEAVAALILGIVCFPLGLIAIIVALTRPDQKQLAEQWRRDSALRQQLERQRRQIARIQHQQTTQFRICPQCGSQNGPMLAACWNCNQSFAANVPEPAGGLDVSKLTTAELQAILLAKQAIDASRTESSGYGPPPAFAPPQIVAAPARRTDAPPVSPEQVDADATPIMDSPPVANVAAKEIKVRCKGCGKRYSGTVAQIAGIRACPRCKAAPFDAETVSS